MVNGPVPKLLCLLKDFFRSLWVVKIHDQRIELLLMNAGHRGFGIAGPVHGNAEAGQYSAQHVCRGVVA